MAAGVRGDAQRRAVDAGLISVVGSRAISLMAWSPVAAIRSDRAGYEKNPDLYEAGAKSHSGFGPTDSQKKPSFFAEY